MRIVPMSAEMLWITPDALAVIEAAGRVCYRSEDRAKPGGAAAFIKRLIASGHESVIEHGAAAFRLVCDRGVSHELVRHRLASYSQESTRYCDYLRDRFGGEIAVIEPGGLEPAAREAWLDGVRAAETAYLAMRAAGASAQMARSVLPTCLKTELVMTANFREWRHLLRLRLAPPAHPQMRELARLIHERLAAEVPAVFEE